MIGRWQSHLLSYCSSAKRYGEFDIEASYLHTLSQRLVSICEGLLDKVSFPGTRCQLLEMRAHAETLSFLDSETPTLRIDGIFRWWNELVDTVDSAPLFPLERFADVLSIMTPVIGTDPRFRKNSSIFNRQIYGVERNTRFV